MDILESLNVQFEDGSDRAKKKPQDDRSAAEELAVEDNLASTEDDSAETESEDDWLEYVAYL